ncbi:MAG: hypothetical protein AAF960_14330 [Bacteroidota bacterium]
MMKELFFCSYFVIFSQFLFGQVHPLPLAHSHNDYEQNRPLIGALENGFTSIEADVLYIYGELFVGHNMPDSANHDLQTLTDQYLQPLYERYQANNGSIYPNYEETFYLWIDIKFEPKKSYRALREAFLPFKEMLNYYENGQLHRGAVTVILSGERPFRDLLKDSLQLMTLDGRLGDLEKNYPSELTPFISEHISTITQKSSYAQLDKMTLRRIIDFAEKAAQQGKKVRLWGTPESEILWAKLEEAGVDLLNTDDLGRLRLYFEARK